jgi:curved DNA-binding protein CbpA
MKTKDYYVILGVAPTESPSGIREAFRDLVKRSHPDRVGPHGDAIVSGGGRSLSGALRP